VHAHRGLLAREPIEQRGANHQEHFLMAIARGYSYTIMPITWRNRRTGVAKPKIKEMGSRYLFICVYVWLEKYFSRVDYQKHQKL
jgi:dolichol-phosphate mannosyltransferase